MNQEHLGLSPLKTPTLMRREGAGCWDLCFSSTNEIFHPPMKIQNLKKDNQASFHESITILKRSLKVVVDLDKKILLTRRPVCRAQVCPVSDFSR